MSTTMIPLDLARRQELTELARVKGLDNPCLKTADMRRLTGMIPSEYAYFHKYHLLGGTKSGRLIWFSVRDVLILRELLAMRRSRVQSHYLQLRRDVLRHAEVVEEEGLLTLKPPADFVSEALTQQG